MIVPGHFTSRLCTKQNKTNTNLVLLVPLVSAE